MKKINFVPLTVSFVGLAIGYILANPLTFQICRKTYTFGETVGCLDPVINFGEPLVTFALFASLVSVALLFVPRQVLHSWFRFAVPFVPLVLLIVFSTPVTSNSWFPLYFVSRYDMAEFAGWLFILISLTIIGVKSIQLRRK